MTKTIIDTILFIGPVAVGKGTQAKTLETNNPKFVKLSTGDLIREEIAAATPRGTGYKSIIAKGERIGDCDVRNLFDEGVQKLVYNQEFNPDRQILLADGMNRTKEQAKQFESPGSPYHVIGVLYFYAGKDKLLSNLRRRMQTEGRIDDSESVLETRLRDYETTTRPVIGYYPEEIVMPVDANGSKERVYLNTVAAVDKILGIRYADSRSLHERRCSRWQF